LFVGKISDILTACAQLSFTRNISLKKTVAVFKKHNLQ